MRCVLMNENEAIHTFDSNNSIEMNEFLGRIIEQVEQMVSEIDSKNQELAMKDEEIAKRDKRIEELEAQLENSKRENSTVSPYLDMDSMINRVVVVANENAKKIEENAQRQAEIIMDTAKKNADRIINESLLTAEKTEIEANLLKRNIRLFKSRAKQLVSLGEELIDDLEKADI